MITLLIVLQIDAVRDRMRWLPLNAAQNTRDRQTQVFDVEVVRIDAFGDQLEVNRRSRANLEIGGEIDRDARRRWT